jgi:phospholipase C
MPEGVMNLNVHWYNQPTIFDRLNERSKSWKVYFGDAPLSLLLVHQWEPPNSIRHRPMMEFYKDVAGAAKDFPAFAWIEPAYLQPGANDCHPPHDVFESQVLLANVYNAIRANEDLWNSTLFVVLFDEHGGFYDHVAPPKAVPPDHHQEEYTFDMLGVRVPAILVSPWMGRRVISEQFDHTSLLRYLTDKWGLGALGERTAQAKSFEPFFLPERRTDTPRSIPKPQALAGPHPVPVETLTAHQNGVVALSHALESMTNEDPSVIAARSRQVLSGPQSQIDAAVDRVTAFLAQQSSKALPK